MASKKLKRMIFYLKVESKYCLMKNNALILYKILVNMGLNYNIVNQTPILHLELENKYH